jgi:hypothetical protein
MTISDTSVGSLVGGISVTPSDTITFNETYRALYVGGAGDVTVRMLRDGAVLPFKGVLAGTLLPIQFDRVMATGTTATLLLALR